MSVIASALSRPGVGFSSQAGPSAVLMNVASPPCALPLDCEECL
jgi:hypothetical protein